MWSKGRVEVLSAYWWSKERIEGTSCAICGLTRHIKGLSGHATSPYGILLS